MRKVKARNVPWAGRDTRCSFDGDRLMPQLGASGITVRGGVDFFVDGRISVG